MCTLRIDLSTAKKESLYAVQNVYRISKERGENFSLKRKQEPFRRDFQPRENFHYFRQQNESSEAILMSLP